LIGEEDRLREKRNSREKSRRYKDVKEITDGIERA